MTSGEFLWKDLPHRYVVEFDQHVTAVAADDFEVLNLDTDQPEPFVLDAYDPLTHRATLRFPGVFEGSGMLASGNYQLRIRPGAVSSAATSEVMTTAHETEFFFLWGDADHNRVVDGTDYAILDSSYVSQAKTFPELSWYENGDFDYSTTWDSTDYSLIDAGFMIHLIEPTDFYAVARSLAEDPNIGIRVSWDANPQVYQWRVERNSYDGQGYVPITGWLDSSTSFYDDSNLADGTWYSYRVRGRDVAGNLIAYTPQRGDYTVLPGPGAPIVTPQSSSEMLLTWTDNASKEAGFNVYRSTSSTGPWELAGLSFRDETSFLDVGLDDNRTYYYYVQAYTRYTTSAPTPVVSAATPLGVPQAPSNLQAASTVPGRIDLSWTDNSDDESGFEVQRFDPGAAAWTSLSITASPSYQDPGRTEGLRYRYRVRARNAAGNSPFSETIEATAAFGVPAAPSGLMAHPGADGWSVELDWTDNSDNEAGFKIECSTDGGSFSQIGWVGANVSSYEATGLTPGRDYAFRVRAFNPTAASTYSNIATPGSGPVGHGAVISNGTIALGINTEGDLNYAGVGLRYAGSGGDGISPGCACEGWGAADAASAVAGFADRDQGVSNLTPVLFSATAATATSVVNVGNTLQVVHEYYPSGNSHLYAARVTIRNISDSSVDLRYRRVSDFDVFPTEFNEFMTIAGDSELIRYTNNNGFAPADPLGSTTEGFPSAADLHSGTFDTVGPFDHGSLFDLGFGEVSAGQSIAFMLYYGAATTRAAAVAALSEVGAEAYALAQPRTSEGTVDDSVNTFMIGLASAAQLPQDVELVAHRTGGKFAQAVSEAVESSNDPAKLLILTNNDAEEPAAITNGQLDFDDTSASIPTGSLNPVDDDLMRITLKRIPSTLTGGTLGIELSNPSAVRLLTSDGTPLTNLTLNLSNPSSNGYLNGVHARDVDVWLEGLQPDQDFVFSWVHRDSTGRELSGDKVHMTIAEWTHVGVDGTQREHYGSVSSRILLEAADRMYWDPSSIDLSAYAFRNRIRGISLATLDQIQAISADDPTIQADDHLVAIPGGVQSEKPIVAYQGRVLAADELAHVESRLGVIAVHNSAIENNATPAGGADRHVRKPVAAAVDPWHHPYPLYLGGSPTQRLIQLTPEQHEIVHRFWDRWLASIDGEDARDIWAALKPEERRTMIKASLVQIGVRIPEEIVDRYMDDFMADEMLEVNRSPDRLPHTECPKIDPAEVEDARRRNPNATVSPDFSGKAAKAIARVERLIDVIAIFAAIGEGLELGQNLMQDPPPLNGVYAACRAWRNNPGNIELETEAKRRITNWIGEYLGDGNVSNAIQTAIAYLDLHTLRFDHDRR
ncbi:fibronectin type III domain-containing protein [Fontivita pretiosa]|uniref:fibronectin type III domain-containing protein n=1 Tax=Fontivita pretiosa TaxID=2989684 RepID=UPI003D175E01